MYKFSVITQKMYKAKHHPKAVFCMNPGVPTGNRTPAAAVKGQCSNR